MDYNIYKNLTVQLEGFPVVVSLAPAHPDLARWCIIRPKNDITPYNRWDTIELNYTDGHLWVNHISVAFYINSSSYDDSAVMCHLFLKCLDFIGVSAPPIENWAYISTRWSNVFVSDDEIETMKRDYIRFLTICKRSHESRKATRALRCGKHWYAVVMQRRRRIQRRVWEHWLELALRPGASLYKLYEARFYNRHYIIY